MNRGSTEPSTKARIFSSGRPEQKERLRSSRLMFTVGATTQRRTQLFSAAFKALLCAVSVASACARQGGTFVAKKGGGGRGDFKSQMKPEASHTAGEILFNMLMCYCNTPNVCRFPQAP